MDPLSLAASIAGLVTLAGATLKVTEDYIHEARHEQETARQFLQELDILHFNLLRLDKLLRSENEAIGYFDDTSVLVSSTHACRTKLHMLHDKLIEGFQTRSSLRRALTWPLQVKEHREMITELRAFAQWVQFSLTINGCKLLAKTSADLLDALRKQFESLQLLQELDERTLSIQQLQYEQSQALEKARAKQERDNILSWVSKFKHKQQHHEICRPRVQVKDQRREVQQQDLEQALLLTQADFEQTFLVIDALDECDNEHRKDLLRSLAALQKEPSVRIFLTSRPHLSQEITKKFENPLQVQIGATDHDLRVYLSSKIDDSDNVDVVDKDFKEEIITKVIQAARKMFLLAALQIRSVLNKTTGGEMEETLEKLPRDLDDAFAETLRRIQKQLDGQDVLGMKTLMWISHARRPLFVAELSEAIAIKPDEESSVIRFVHFSVQEYLHKYQERVFTNGGHLIAEACITYMLFEPFTFGPRQYERDLVELISQNVFVDYAAHHWGYHIQSGKDEVLDRLALKFLRAEAQRGCSNQILHYTRNLRKEYWIADEARSCNSLHLAAMFGLENLGRQLLDNDKVGIDDATKNGTTALIKAAAGGHKDFTKMLLDRQVDQSKENWYGSALHCAAEAGEVATILVLLENGLNVDIRDRHGHTSLHCAAAHGYSSATQALLDHGADVNAICNKSYTPLRYAIAWEQPIEILRILLASGAHTEIRDSDNITPLQDAVVWNTEDTVLILLEHRADVHAKYFHHRTPLHLAAERNHASIVQYLLDHGASIDAKAQDGATALYLAAEGGNKETVRVLLRNGADLESGDTEGFTPLDVARQRYDVAIVGLLIGAGAKLHQETKFATPFQVNEPELAARAASKIRRASFRYRARESRRRLLLEI
ncbi:hypothetical protein P7C71_g5177, partial [Lecanoromycetidae sp. Uapishka_2]